jgi:hypothetical protein
MSSDAAAPAICLLEGSVNVAEVCCDPNARIVELAESLCQNSAAVDRQLLTTYPLDALRAILDVDLQYLPLREA